MIKTKFVISNKGFSSLKEAEELATGHLMGGQFHQRTKCYKVIKVFKPIIKFKEVK